jgi:glyoxylase-like metal-dependent hydrolase (beta-lactamase superfamily II)
VMMLAAHFFKNHPNAGWLPTANELAHTFIFRFSLCAYLLHLDWIAHGSQPVIRPEKIFMGQKEGESRYSVRDAVPGQPMLDFLHDAGVPPTKLPDLNFASMMIRGQVTMAVPDVLFEDGREVDVPGWDLRTVWTPGHSPGHVCFYSERHRLLLSGDHVLPRITPNIGVHTQQFPNPLGEYLESLLQVQNLGVDEVLPAHEYRFAGLGARLDEIITHHAERLAEIERLIDEHLHSDVTQFEKNANVAYDSLREC